jgi:iron complex outermembrane receptor protein
MFRRRRAVAGLARAGATAAAMLVGLIAAPAVYAQDATVRFSVPAQPLVTGLLVLGSQARISIAASTDLIAGQSGKAVEGDLTVREALSRMLAGTDLSYDFITPQAVRVFRGAAPTGTEAPLVSEVLVIGTHITGQEPIGSQVASLGRDDIRKSGRTGMAEVLQLFTQVQTIGTYEGVRGGRGQGGYGNSNAGSQVNLRGLGSESTLALVNERRIAPSGAGAYVDISQIPVSAVERVEVLPDGASALYGSDAVGGVVNFVLRKKYDGAESTLHYGAGDGFDEITAAQTLGKSWDTGSAVLSYEYYDRSRLRATDRDYYRADLTRFGGSNFIPSTGSTAFTSNPGTIVAGGLTYAIPTGQNGEGLTFADLGPAGSRNILDPQRAIDIQPQQRRHSLVGSVEQELTPGIRVFADAFYSQREFVKRNQADTQSLVIGTSNPFFISGIPGAPTTNTVRYSFIDDYDSRTEGSSTNYTLTGGFNFDLPKSWSGELYVTTGRDDVDTVDKDRVNTARLALAAGTPGAGGVRPVGLAYFNPYGDGSSTDPATLDYIRGSMRDRQIYEIRSVTASASGPLFTLPGGTVRMAVGADLREESYKTSQVNDRDQLTPLKGLASAGFGKQDREVTAAYAELSVPVFGPDNAVPGIQKLDVSFAVRGEHYSDFGNTTNPKIGARWQPIEGLSIRGSWGTSFRAPRLAQLNEATNLYTDRPFPNPAEVVGSPSYYATIGGTPYSFVTLLAAGSNADLKPETADTWTAGFDFKPEFLPGFQASVTYYNIKYKNRILLPTSAELVGALAAGKTGGILLVPHPTQAQIDAIHAGNAAGVGLPAGGFTDSFGVLPAESIYAIVSTAPANYGEVDTDGWDVSASYSRRTRLGTWQVGGAVSVVSHYRVQRMAGEPFNDLVDTISNPVSLRGRATLGWADGSLDAQVALNHVGGYRNTTLPTNAAINPWDTVDFHLGYRFENSAKRLNGLSLALDVENLFGEDPPFVNNADAQIGYDPEMASARGRIVALSLRKVW